MSARPFGYQPISEQERLGPPTVYRGLFLYAREAKQAREATRIYPSTTEQEGCALLSTT